MEIEHGSRAAIVGDNGQGKTTLLRTLVGSLKPVVGDIRWGFGCKTGVYAQHVYTALNENQTVIEYLRSKGSGAGKKEQELLDVAGSFLFRGDAIQKPVSVLSGGERARLCLAGLMVADHNVLVLDEPGNHLDVDTVDALAEALADYPGTVIFTSHDRSFTGRVATAIIEVRDGRAVAYSGQYQAYLDKVTAEIDAGERAAAAAKPAPPGGPKPAAAPAAARPRDDKAARKELKTVEKAIAQLDARKRELDAEALTLTSAKDAMRVHTEVTTVTAQLAAAEDRWLELQAVVGE